MFWSARAALPAPRAATPNLWPSKAISGIPAFRFQSPSEAATVQQTTAPSAPSASAASPSSVTTITAHTAGVRPYWLCQICKEPGAERTPFSDPNGEGWEDDLSHPREAGELVSALESTWTIVEDCLQRWTPETLQVSFRRETNGKITIHTRQSVLMRLLTHDAYHCGEIAQALGMHGLPEVDIWTGRVPILSTPT